MLVAVVFGIISVAVSALVEEYLLDQRIEDVRKNVSSVSVQVAPYLVQSDAAELYNIVSAASSENGGRLLVLNDSAIVQTDSFSKLNGVKLSENEINDILYGQKSSSFGYHKIYDDSAQGGFFWALFSTSAVISNGQTVGVVLYSTSINDVVQQTRNLNAQMLYIYVLACGVVIISSMILSQLVTKPVQQMTDVALRVSAGDLSSRANVKGRSELAELGDTFNMMVDRLQNIDKQRGEFVSDASHELKTPLASMKILVESLLYQDTVDEAVYKEFLGDINGEIDRLDGLITDLLLLSKMDNDGGLPVTEKLSMTKLVEMCVAALIPIARKKNVTVDFPHSDEVSVEGDALKLRQAVNNLIDNAIKYSKQDGRVDISVRRFGQEVYVAVEDDGIGMSKEHLAHIFERFYRVDKARARDTGGTGLGLHIVRRIALMHGGRVEVASREGEGSRFTLILPAVQAKTEKPEEKPDEE